MSTYVTPKLDELFTTYLGIGGIFSKEFRDGLMGVYFASSMETDAMRKRVAVMVKSHRFLSKEFTQFVIDAFEEYFEFRDERERKKLEGLE
jgi:hypothetical protein